MKQKKERHTQQFRRRLKEMAGGRVRGGKSRGSGLSKVPTMVCGKIKFLADIQRWKHLEFTTHPCLSCTSGFCHSNIVYVASCVASVVQVSLCVSQTLFDCVGDVLSSCVLWQMSEKTVVVSRTPVDL